jgi:peptidoglycan/xylan/chitin deacetylase (PgdA/CDA1 family)
VPPARVALYVASAGALALSVRSIAVGPISMAIAAGALSAYVALILCGVFFLRLGMFVDVVTRGPREARGVALTFDDGPSLEHTPKILDQLDEAGVKATFFLIGRKVLAHPELARDIVERGHAIGVHGFTHTRLFSLLSPEAVRIDTARAIDAIASATGQTPTLFRPPIGHTSPRVAQALEAFDLTVVGWSVRGLDGLAGARPERVAARIVPRLEDGAIVLLHDAAERDDFEPASLKALPRILTAMQNRDLPGVRLDAWITSPL